MKATLLYGHKDVRVEDWPEPVAPPGWSVVEVGWSSICHSDIKEYLGPYYVMRHGRPNPITGVSLPVILGHEFAGTVVSMNGEHPGIQVGDRVAPDGCIKDGTCWYCEHGRYNLCDGLAILGFDAHGSHARYVAVPNYSLHRVPDNVSDEEAAFVEPLAVATHGIRQGRVAVGDIVAVIGAGMIGLCALSAAGAAGASKVFVSEPLEGRRTRAAAMGATVLDPNDGDLVAQLLDQTGGHGADVAIDCVGLESSLDSALSLSRKGGRVVIVGTYPKKPLVNMDKIGLEEREVIGSLAYADDFPRAISLLANGSVDLSSCVTGRIALRDIVEQGFERMDADANQQIRILVDTHAA